MQLHGCNAREETGLSGHWRWRQAIRLTAELRQFRHCFQAALNGVKTDWRHWLVGPRLTPSHDDTLSSMLLAAWDHGALDARSGRQFFACSDNSQPCYHSGERQLFTLCRERIFRLAILHFVHALSCPVTAVAIDSLLALGHTSGADTSAGVLLGQQLLQGKP
ncbi:DUF2877 domain-containing protein [Escherichia coli]